MKLSPADLYFFHCSTKHNMISTLLLCLHLDFSVVQVFVYGARHVSSLTISNTNAAYKVFIYKVFISLLQLFKTGHWEQDRSFPTLIFVFISHIFRRVYALVLHWKLKHAAALSLL